MGVIAGLIENGGLGEFLFFPVFALLPCCIGAFPYERPSGALEQARLRLRSKRATTVGHGAQPTDRAPCETGYTAIFII